VSQNQFPDNSTTVIPNLQITGAFQDYFETIAWSSLGVTPSSMTAYGVTAITVASGNPSTSPFTITVGAPITGTMKTIIVDSTAAYINSIDLNLGTGVRIDGTSDNQFIAFSSLATAPQTLQMVGISTSQWKVVSVNSTVGMWGLATGIRGATVVRTS